MDDGAFIDLAGKIIKAGSDTEDPRIHALVEETIKLVKDDPNTLATLLLRYEHLQALEDKGEFAGLQLENDPPPN